ncbi:unnamed protein product [Closterium sp. Yama58-4]|nr:unnamed protein product [Closterium sp. Yama58-4]
MFAMTSKTPVVPLSQRPLDALLVLFFAVYAFSTAVVAKVLLPPRALLAEALRDAVLWPGSPRDFLVACKLLLHMTFCLAAIFAFCFGGEWIRLPAGAYSVHAITTMTSSAFEFVEEISSKYPQPLGLMHRIAGLMLLAIYLPVLALPCMLLVRVSLPASLFHYKHVTGKKKR